MKPKLGDTRRGLGCFIGVEEVGNEIFIANAQSPQPKHGFKPTQLVVCIPCSNSFSIMHPGGK